MATWVQFSDVEARSEEPIPEADEARIGVYIEDAEALLRRKVPTLAARIASGAVEADLVTLIVSDAVLRLYRNPEGFRQENSDEYAYVRPADSASSRIRFTDEDLAILGGGNGNRSGSIQVRIPSYRRPGRRR